MILIKCSEQNCKMVNSVEKTAFRNHLLKGGQPVIACKGCKTKLEVMPLKTVCCNPSCNKVFRYYDFMLNELNPVVQCPHCQGKNRIKTRAIPEKLK